MANLDGSRSHGARSVGSKTRDSWLKLGVLAGAMLRDDPVRFWRPWTPLRSYPRYSLTPDGGRQKRPACHDPDDEFSAIFTEESSRSKKATK